MDQMKKYYRNWLFAAPFGLVLIGMGACFIAEAAMLKFSGVETSTWVLAGTGALIVFNSGISIFGSAVIARVKYLQEKESQ